jgi:hypothetical protein
MRTVTDFGDCFERLVKEFLGNVPEGCTDPLSKDFQKVHVRGKVVIFSPKVINKYLGRDEEPHAEVEVTDNALCKALTGGQVKAWPIRAKVPAGKLTVKYALLNRIGSVNWVPTLHTSDISTGLAKFIYIVANKIPYDFGQYIFDQTLRHGKSGAVSLPIAFPTLLCGIIISQHPGIVSSDDVAKKRESPLIFHYKLFSNQHVPDIVGTSSQAAPVQMTRKDVIAGLKDVCKEFDEKKEELDRMFDAKKKMFEDMIAALEREEDSVAVDADTLQGNVGVAAEEGTGEGADKDGDDVETSAGTSGGDTDEGEATASSSED